MQQLIETNLSAVVMLVIAAVHVPLTSLIDVSEIFLKSYVDKMTKTAAMDDLR
jgi:hypothetical protein